MSIQNYIDRLNLLRQAGKGGGLAGLMQPDMSAVRTREAELKKYLGQTNYAKQLEEAQNLGKLQLGLALAQRGFAAAGATPQRGESTVSTLSRELLSPLAGDAGAVATQMMKQRQASDAAKAAEDRQIKAMALQQITSEDAAFRDLATKLAPEASSGLLETPYYVIQKDESGKWDYVPQADGKGQMQVRQQKNTGAPYNVQTLKLQPLLSNQAIVTASDLGKYGLGKPAGKDTIKVSDAGMAREILAIKDGVKEYGPLVETKIVFKNGTASQVRGDNNKDITIGSELGNYEMFQKPTGPATTPKGTKDPEFLDSFRGMVAQMGDQQEKQGLGKTSVRFDAKKFAANPDLTPGENFPFSKVVGVNQDTGEIITKDLSESEQQVYANNLRASYLNVFDSIKTGQQPADINNTFIARELSKSLGALGLSKEDQLPAGVVMGREQITDPAAITAAYKNAVSGFATDVQGTLNNLPFPREDKDLRTGTGKAVLFSELGVDFGPLTVSPAPLPIDSDAATIETRATKVRNLDSSSIQNRILAEKISKETGINSKLRTKTADSRGKQLTVVNDALNAEREKLTKAISTPGAAASAEVLDKSLEMLAQLQKLDYAMKQSGVTGFVTGPLEANLKKFLGLNVGGYFRTPEGQQAANRFIATIPIVEQLFARDILKETGEQRYTDRDLKGAQNVLVKLNESDDFNKDKLNQLTGYLKNLVKSGLTNAGTFDISSATLEKAAMLGIDLKSITPKNNFYSPYFNQGKYAVTKQPIPQFSRQYMKSLRDDGIFGYAAVRNTTGGAVSYKLIKVDDKGLPVPKDPKNLKAGFKTVTYVGDAGWKNLVPKKELDFNRNYLLKTYSLDR